MAAVMVLGAGGKGIQWVGCGFGKVLGLLHDIIPDAIERAAWEGREGGAECPRSSRAGAGRSASTLQSCHI